MYEGISGLRSPANKRALHVCCYIMTHSTVRKVGNGLCSPAIKRALQMCCFIIFIRILWFEFMENKHASCVRLPSPGFKIWQWWCDGLPDTVAHTPPFYRQGVPFPCSVSYTARGWMILDSTIRDSTKDTEPRMVESEGNGTAFHKTQFSATQKTC